jgi:hypothetical protein
MDVNAIKAELGPVVGQLLEYQYQAVPRAEQEKGQANASSSARGWIESVVNSSSQPDENVLAGFHSGAQGTCDAVEFRYAVGEDSGRLDLRIDQTIFVLTLSATPRVGLSEWKGDAEQAASELARRLFVQSDRWRLQRVKTVGALSFGEQIIPPTKPSDQIDWLDTVRWWSDGTGVGFAVLKRTGAGQAYKASWDLQPNRVWFAMFERPRAS